MSGVRDVNRLKPNRREFLYYLGGAGLTVLLGQTCASLTWFAKPQARFGIDVFRLDVDMIPQPDARPFFFREAQAWGANTQSGLLAFSFRCPLEGADIKWYPFESRFSCPHCGTKFRLNGTIIHGPARRELDRFRVEVITSADTYTTPMDGSPVSIADAQSIVLDTRYKILGAPRPNDSP